jgi:hypothetical protein
MSKTGIYVDAELLFDPDYPLRRTIIKWAERAGLKLAKQFGTFFSYALVFEKD